MTPDFRFPIPDSPRCAVLTPAGRGAIATIGVRGAAAVELVGRRFSPAAGRPLSSFVVGRVVFGRFKTSADGSEELVVGLVAADEVEIHCHGGQAAVTAICDAVVSEGCQLVPAGDWAREQEDDPIAAQALQALSQARTPSTAAILLDQYRGALSAELQRIEDLLDGGPSAAATEAIGRLLARGRVGLHLTVPWKVVLAGAPNAGKSSLANAILGYERAIVFHQPGTTRDVLTAATAIGGWPVELADMAGLRPTNDALEAEGVARAHRQVAEADLVVFVTDTTARWDKQLYKQVTGRGGRTSIVAHNKCDLAPPPADGRPAGIAISAKMGHNIDALLAAIAQKQVPDPPHRGEAVPFTMTHVAALNDVAGQIASGDLKSAHQRLKTLRLIGA